MGLWKKKPVTIEARYWDGSIDAASELIDWVLGFGRTATWRCVDSHLCAEPRSNQKVEPEHDLVIATLEGYMKVSPGDYIIRCIQDDFYPCKPDIFLETYEAILESE